MIKLLMHVMVNDYNGPNYNHLHQAAVRQKVYVITKFVHNCVSNHGFLDPGWLMLPGLANQVSQLLRPHPKQLGISTLIVQRLD